jgi:hypothetical protein
MIRLKGMAAIAAVALLATMAGARANIMFDPGNDPQANEQNIMFESHFTGMNTSFIGDTNMTNTPITFDIPTVASLLKETGIGTDGKGQADIVCDTGCGPDGAMGANGMQLENLEIKLAPGFGATDFIGNLDFGEGTFDINVTDQMGAVFDYALGNGQNFFTLTATAGEVITDIQITGEQASGGNIGFNDFKQPRISGVCKLVGTTCTAIAVPEPASLSVMGFGLIGMAWLLRRKQKSQFAI